jgi:hypothetical protein
MGFLAHFLGMAKLNRIFFAWVGGNEAFNPAVHNREDEKIARMKISQREGEAATAEVEIMNPRIALLGPSRPTRCHISVEIGNNIVHVFSGKVEGWPSDLSAQFVTLTFLGIPNNFEALRLDYLQQLKVVNHYEQLTIPQGAENSSEEILATRNGELYVDRRTNAISLSPYVSTQGPTEFFNDNTIEVDSLSTTIREAPVTAVRVNYSVEWTQRGFGIFSARPKINRAFLSGRPNTLTPDSFESSFPTAGSSIGTGAGYEVFSSRLREVASNISSFQQSGRTLVSNFLDPSGDPLVDEDLEDRVVEVERVWYDARLEIAATYEQNRRENITYTLAANLQAFSGTPRVEEITVNVADPTLPRTVPLWQPRTRYAVGDTVVANNQIVAANILHISSDNFFNDASKWIPVNLGNLDLLNEGSAYFTATTLGTRILANSSLRAARVLLQSIRSVETKFRTNFENALNVTTDSVVRIDSADLAGGFAIGKVIEYSFDFEGDSGEYFAEISIASVPGTSNFNNVGINAFYSTLEPVDPFNLNSSLIQSVVVENPGEDQMLAVRSAPTVEEIQGRLSGLETTIQINLKELITYPIIQVNIFPTVSGNFTYPRQVNIT